MEQHTKSHLLTTKKTPIKKTKTAAKYDDHEPQHDKMNTKNHVIVLSYNNNFTHKYAQTAHKLRLTRHSTKAKSLIFSPHSNNTIFTFHFSKFAYLQ